MKCKKCNMLDIDKITNKAHRFKNANQTKQHYLLKKDDTEK